MASRAGVGSLSCACTRGLVNRIAIDRVFPLIMHVHSFRTREERGWPASTAPLGPGTVLNIKKTLCGGRRGKSGHCTHPRSQAAYADCGTRRGMAEMRGVCPKITPLLPFGLRTGRSTLKPKLVGARGQAHSPSRRAASGGVGVPRPPGPRKPRVVVGGSRINVP